MTETGRDGGPFVITIQRCSVADQYAGETCGSRFSRTKHNASFPLRVSRNVAKKSNFNYWHLCLAAIGKDSRSCLTTMSDQGSPRLRNAADISLRRRGCERHDSKTLEAKLTVAQMVTKFPVLFLNPEGTLVCTQQSATECYPGKKILWAEPPSQDKHRLKRGLCVKCPLFFRAG